MKASYLGSANSGPGTGHRTPEDGMHVYLYSLPFCVLKVCRFHTWYLRCSLGVQTKLSARKHGNKLLSGDEPDRHPVRIFGFEKQFVRLFTGLDDQSNRTSGDGERRLTLSLIPA